LTYDHALEIKNNSENFIEKKFNINGTDISIFCYHVSTFKDFETNGILDRSKLHMRSNLFIHLKGIDLNIPSLPKFFNINENEHTLYSSLKDKEIICVQEKADGSLLQPIIIDGKIIWRTQKSFDNDQTRLAEEFISNNPNYETFIRHEIEVNHNNLFFELTSPLNKIVVDYSETQLKLLSIRSSLGVGFPLTTKESFFNDFGISTAKTYHATLDELIEKQQTEKNIEGWVVYFSDLSMIKIKTLDYFQKHHLVSSIEREHDIIKLFLDGSIDDVLTQLSEHDSEKRAFVENIIEITEHKRKLYKDRIELNLETYHNLYDCNRKLFASDFNTDSLFTVTMRHLNNSNPDDINTSINNYILYNTKTLSSARKWLASSF
jgi:RNA ligase